MWNTPGTLIAVRVLISALLGGLIGLERESHGRPAGFRTHILVAMGASLLMLVSLYGFERLPQGGAVSLDPSRIAAQVVSGIGFLGAGTILRSGTSVKGLTTAASLWVVAGIGLATGAGFFFGAILTTAMAVLTLYGLNLVEHRFLTENERSRLLVRVETMPPGLLGNLLTVLQNQQTTVRSIKVNPIRKGKTTVEIYIDSLDLEKSAPLVDALVDLADVDRVELD